MRRVIRSRWSVATARGRAVGSLSGKTLQARRGRSLERRRTPLLPLVAALAISASSCVYDEDDRCGPDRVLADSLCVCAPGLVAQGTACVPPEEPAPGGLGLTCDASSMPCTDPVFSFCHVPTDETEGYCTTMGCTGNADCEGGYLCALTETPAFCKRPPTGEGMACAAEDDCEQFEASFCTVGSPSGVTCVVPDCVDDADCSPGRLCMDLSGVVPGLPTLCLPAE